MAARSKKATPKVMVVSHEASRTGAPKVAVHLLRALRRNEVETVVIHRWGGPMKRELDRAALNGRLEPLSTIRVALRRRQRTKRLARRVESFAINRVITRERPDVIWCNTVLTATYARVARSRGIPCVIYSHEARDLAQPALERAHLLEPSIPLDGIVLVGCSTASAAILDELIPTPASPARVLHSPVDVDAVRREAGIKQTNATLTNDRVRHRRTGEYGSTVVAVGKGNRRKGVGVFAKAAALTTSSNIRWVWVGEVSPAQRSTHVDYVGEVPTAAPEIAKADVFVLPSISDQFPLVVLEAMALAKPVIATRLPGTVEQLGDTGVYVEPHDHQGLADAVTNLIGDTQRASALGDAAAARCDELWGIEAFDEKVMGILELAMGSQDHG